MDCPQCHNASIVAKSSLGYKAGIMAKPYRQLRQHSGLAGMLALK
jgi:hypothetical protein